jgi:CheY-like chemotaxis protein
MIQQRKPLNQIVEYAEKNKFKALDVAAVELLKQGIVSFDEIKEYIVAAKRSNSSPITPSPEIVALSSEAKPSSMELSSQSGSIKKPVALVVDDDKDVRAIFSMILKKEMYEVIEASNGLEGLEKIYERCPKIILCDLMMPVMDGKELLIKLRSSDQTKNVPVVILTAAHNEENEVALIDLGAKDFINKTSSPGVITSRLRRILSS